MAERDHWPEHARRWQLVGPPLRPCADDVALMERTVGAWTDAAGRPPRALLLGATPELARMPWADGTRLVGVDRSLAMIASQFPRHPRAIAVQGDWRALPVADASFDIVLGDGAPATLPLADHEKLASELARVLVPGGLVALRVFVALEPRETLGDVADALRGGRIGSFHALKWRLAMAVHADERDVAVRDIAGALDAIAPDRAALAAATGWPHDVIAGIDIYRASGATYSFPSLATFSRSFARFAAPVVHVPTYELGERCPTLVWTR